MYSNACVNHSKANGMGAVQGFQSAKTINEAPVPTIKTTPGRVEDLYRASHIHQIGGHSKLFGEDDQWHPRLRWWRQRWSRRRRDIGEILPGD